MPLKFRIRFFSFPRCDAGCHFYLNTLWVKPTHLLAVFRNMCLSDSETKKKKTVQLLKRITLTPYTEHTNCTWIKCVFCSQYYQCASERMP